MKHLTKLLIAISLIIVCDHSVILRAQGLPPAVPIEISGNDATPDNTDLTQWTGRWEAPQAIFDRGTYQDDPDNWSQDDDCEGSTWENNTGSGYGILVVDLQQLRLINRFRVFQMFCDGETRGIEIFQNTDYTGSTAPLSTDNGWASVSGGVVSIGDGIDNSTYISDPTAIDVTEFSSRYIKIHAYYDGGDYIELKGIKAFYYSGSTYSINYMRGGPLPTLTITTEPVTNTELTTTTGNGTITELGLSSVTAHGVCWNTSGNPSITDDHTDEGTATSTGSFTTSITGLSQGATYYLKAYATDSEGTVYGSEETFTTSAGEPLVTTQAASNIDFFTATGNGTISFLGNSNPTAHGVCWNTTGNPTISNSHTDQGSTSSTGSFTSEISGLTPNTWYYLRAYATNEQGTGYGDQVWFKTNNGSAPGVTTQDVTDIGSSAATGNGTLTDLGDINPTSYGVCWNTSGWPTIANSHTNLGDASATGAFTTSITGLLSNTTYYVRAYATNYFGTTYGDEVSFTSSNPFDWYALGTGSTNDLYAAAVSGNDVYAGGLFTSIGGNSINRIAKWNGTSWSGLGQGVGDGIVLAIVINGNDIYIGGTFITVDGNSISKIAKWDGNSWSAITTTPPNGNVSCLTMIDNELYAGGDFSTIDGVDVNNIAKWNGSSWSALGTGVNGSVNTFATDGTNLYAGGSFTGINGINNGIRIAKWDGSNWSGFGSGISQAAVYAIALVDENIYAGGSFSDASYIPNTRNLAKWDGSSWSSIGTLGSGTKIQALATSNGALYAGGYFSTINGVNADNIAKWDGTSWSKIGSNDFNGVNSTINSLVVQPATSSMIVAGQFSQTNSISNGSYISRFTDENNNFLDSFIWTGLVSTNWNLGGNWNVNTVPASYNDVTVPSVGITNFPVIGSGNNANCKNITIENGASLTIQSTASGTGTLLENGTITNAGTINIQRYITPDSWHLISMPNNVTTSNTFLGDYLQTWDETSAQWSDIIPTINPLSTVNGYALWVMPEVATTYTFTGTPNSGNQSTSITYTEVINNDFDGANLLGNPYPSSIDWSGLDDTWGAAYYYNGTGYVSWNNGEGSGSQFIPPMQGFFIVATEAGTFQLTNDDRTHSGATGFYKVGREISKGLVLEASNGEYADALHVLFRAEATDGFDLQKDAYKFLSGEPGVSEIYTYCEDKMLSIDVRPETEMMQLGFKNDIAGLYSISLSKIADIPNAILEDTKTQRVHNLMNGNYEFAWNPELDDENRFILHFKAVGINENQIADNDILIYAVDNEIFIKGAESGKVTVVDIMGRVVLQQEISGQGIISIPANLKTGVYVVMVQSGNGNKTEKIFIK